MKNLSVRDSRGTLPHEQEFVENRNRLLIVVDNKRSNNVDE